MLEDQCEQKEKRLVLLVGVEPMGHFSSRIHVGQNMMINPAKLDKKKAPKERERKIKSSPNEEAAHKEETEPLRTEPSTSCMKHVN
jgi:hypothetical protein